MSWTEQLAVVVTLWCACAAATETTLAPGAPLQNAVNSAAAGDVLVLKGGQYQGPVCVSVANLTIQSAAGEMAHITCPVKGASAACITTTHGGKGLILRRLEVSGGAMHAVDINATDCRVEGCKLHDSGADCLKCSPGAHKLEVLGCEIYASGQDQGWNANAEGIDNVRGDNMHVADCFIHDIATNGIYAKGGARGLLVERCLFMRIGFNKDVLGSGVVAGEHAGGTVEYESYDATVRNCIFKDIRGAAMAAWCAKNARFYNNTCLNVATHDRAGFMIIENHNRPSKDVLFVNNILVVGSKRNLVWIYPKGLEGTLVMDHNIYFGGNGKFEDGRSGWSGSLEQWQKKLGVDAHSLYDDPKSDATGHLADGSPAIDKAQSVEGLTDDYDGGKREGAFDIGADEFKAGEPLQVPPPAGTVGTGRK